MLIGGRYQVERELGKGGFGVTHAAIDQETGRRVAVKVLDLRRVADWKAVELFEREARVLRTLDHPGIPAYIEFRPLEAEREAYLVQALAPGDNLLALLERRRFAEADLVDLADRVLAILEYLTGLVPIVVHRDVKPANILLADDGAVSLVDFGAVRDLAGGGGVTVAGTFGYMAPEQLHGEAHPSSDLYGLGMTLVHLATGRTPEDLERKRLKPDFAPHTRLSRRLVAFIERLIEPVPDDRFADASAARAALRELGEPAAPISSAAIARMRKDAAKPAVRAPAPMVARRSQEDRVSLDEDDEGVTLTIVPARGWRGREAHLGFLSVFAVLGLVAAGAAWGATGAAAGSAVTVALVGLLLWSAPTWRLRVTTRGDFIFYPRSPRRPSWVGNARDLRVVTQPTATGMPLVSLAHATAGKAHDFYPLSGADANHFRDVARWIEKRFGVRTLMSAN